MWGQAGLGHCGGTLISRAPGSSSVSTLPPTCYKPAMPRSLRAWSVCSSLLSRHALPTPFQMSGKFFIAIFPLQRHSREHKMIIAHGSYKMGSHGILECSRRAACFDPVIVIVGSAGSYSWLRTRAKPGKGQAGDMLTSVSCRKVSST